MAAQCSACQEIFVSRNKLFTHLPICPASATAQQAAQHDPTVDDDSTSAYLYVVGGRLRNRTLAKVERFAFESQLWETMPYLLEPRGSHGAVLCCGALYAVAGGGLHSNLVTCERLDAGASKWEPTKQPVSLARHALAVVECCELIYAIGGWVDGTYGTGLTERFDPRTEVWRTCAPMAVPRRLHAAAATQWDNKVYVFGGAVEGEKNCKSVECYDPVTDVWQPRADMPIAACAHAATVGSHIYVFVFGKRVYQYDPAKDTYRSRAELPFKEWHCFTATVAGTRIYVLGGASQGKWTGAACYYDTTRDSWHHLPNMPTARRRTDAVFWRHPKSACDTSCNTEY